MRQITLKSKVSTHNHFVQAFSNVKQDFKHMLVTSTSKDFINYHTVVIKYVTQDFIFNLGIEFERIKNEEFLIENERFFRNLNADL